MDPAFLVLMDKPARHVRYNQLGTVAIASTPEELVEQVGEFLKR
jgi:4-hydroxy-3-methylbut-2-enyl diphosphate reductase IspH